MATFWNGLFGINLCIVQIMSIKENKQAYGNVSVYQLISRSASVRSRPQGPTGGECHYGEGVECGTELDTGQRRELTVKIDQIGS